jgi:aminoglycoside 6'-N-acetyltransferase
MDWRENRLPDLNLLQHWDDQPHVIDSDPNDDWHWETELDRTPEWREQLIAELDDRPTGFILKLSSTSSDFDRSVV